MPSAHHERLAEVFLAACELPADERSAWLDEACAGDAAIRAEVEALLSRDAQRGGVLDGTALVRAGQDLADLAGDAGDMPESVGPWRLLRIIGRGGMGIVCLAEQREPVERRVALKIIKLGMDTRQVLARFEAERQVLAMMDHPNVARLFDAGATATGRPYFAMEYVPGAPITEYCDRERLDVRGRLALFMQVCDAVQHAHQKGVIHRDLKPSNVLVAAGTAKVIDFGIAKATGQRLTERTMFTEQGQVIGTPEYMSPEQAELAADDIDTRSDIYSLGVLLYELLTGVLPFDRRALQQAAFSEVQRIIREQEPSRPSVRRREPRSLVRELRGDLDWITMKALEKDRSRRYATASELVADIRRHLADEPVLAGPPSTVYRMRKFVRRHAAGVAAGTVAAAGLLAAAAVSLTFALSEAEQRRIASTERDIAEAINEFFNRDLLASVAPSEEAGRGRDVLMRDVLDEAGRRIGQAAGPGGRFQDKPLVEASIQHTLGATYRQLGLYSEALPCLERALSLRRRELGEEHPDTLGSIELLAMLSTNLARLDEAERLQRGLIETRRRVQGPEHPDTLFSTMNLGVTHRKQGRNDEAQAIYEEVLAIQDRVLGPEHLQRLQTASNLAVLHADLGHTEEAERRYQELLAIETRALGEGHVLTLKCMNNLANLYGKQARYPEAEQLHEAALDIRKRVLGAEHPETLSSMMNLANLYGKQGHHGQAERTYVALLEIQERALGPEHPDTLISLMNLANVYTEQGRYEETERTYRQLLEIQGRVIGPEHPDTLASMNNLAMLYTNQGRFEEAERLQLQALLAKTRVLGPEHQDTLISKMNLAVTRKELGRLDEAERAYLDLLEIMGRTMGERHPYRLVCMSNLAELYFGLGRLEQAEPLQETAVRLAKVTWPRGTWYTGSFLADHGRTLTALARYEQAEAALTEAHALLSRTLGPSHERTVAAAAALAALYDAWGRPQSAAEWRATPGAPKDGSGHD